MKFVATRRGKVYWRVWVNDPGWILTWKEAMEELRKLVEGKK